MDLSKKLQILADAAKYDASCASSGAARKDSRGSKGVGSTGGAGICHSYTPDGRCISFSKSYSPMPVSTTVITVSIVDLAMFSARVSLLKRS